MEVRLEVNKIVNNTVCLFIYFFFTVSTFKVQFMYMCIELFCLGYTLAFFLLNISIYITIDKMEEGLDGTFKETEIN